MEPAGYLNISGSGMPRSITEEVDHGSGEVVLGAQPLQWGREPHLLSLALALHFSHVPRHLRIHEPRRDRVDPNVIRR